MRRACTTPWSPSADHHRRERAPRRTARGPFPLRGLSVRTGAAGLRCNTVYWFFTVLLIAVSAGTVVFACYLLRRLFTTEPAAVDVPVGQKP